MKNTRHRREDGKLGVTGVKRYWAHQREGGGRRVLPEEGGPAEEAKLAHTGILKRGWWWRWWRGGRFLYPDHSLCSTVMVA